MLYEVCTFGFNRHYRNNRKIDPPFQKRKGGQKLYLQRYLFQLRKYIYYIIS